MTNEELQQIRDAERQFAEFIMVELLALKFLRKPVLMLSSCHQKTLRSSSMTTTQHQWVSLWGP